MGTPCPTLTRPWVNTALAVQMVHETPTAIQRKHGSQQQTSCDHIPCFVAELEFEILLNQLLKEPHIQMLPPGTYRKTMWMLKLRFPMFEYIAVRLERESKVAYYNAGSLHTANLT